MKITQRQLRSIIREIIAEQFTIPIHNKHSDFELFTELTDDDDSEKSEKDEIDEIWAAEVGDSKDAEWGGLEPNTGPWQREDY